MSEEKIGFMCLTDYKFHLDGDELGSRVYPSIEALKEHRKCVRDDATGRCGIAKVSIKLAEVVAEADY